MVKKIEVDSCEHCPLRDNFHDWDGHTWSNACRHPQTDGMKIGHIDIIHPDCPLKEND